MSATVRQIGIPPMELADVGVPPRRRPTVWQALFSPSYGMTTLSGGLLFLAMFLPLQTGCDGQQHTSAESFTDPALHPLEAIWLTWPFCYGLALGIAFTALALLRPRRGQFYWGLIGFITWGLGVAATVTNFWEEWGAGILWAGPPLAGHLVWCWWAWRKGNYRSLSARLQSGCAGLSLFWLWLLTLFAQEVHSGFYLGLCGIFGILIAAWIARVRLEYDLVDRSLPKQPIRFSVRSIFVATTLLGLLIGYYQALQLFQ